LFSGGKGRHSGSDLEGERGRTFLAVASKEKEPGGRWKRNLKRGEKVLSVRGGQNKTAQKRFLRRWEREGDVTNEKGGRMVRHHYAPLSEGEGNRGIHVPGPQLQKSGAEKDFERKTRLLVNTLNSEGSGKIRKISGRKGISLVGSVLKDGDWRKKLVKQQAVNFVGNGSTGKKVA